MEVRDGVLRPDGGMMLSFADDADAGHRGDDDGCPPRAVIDTGLCRLRP